MQKKVTRNYRRPKQNLHRSRLGQPRFCHHMVLRIVGLVVHVTYGKILGTNDPKSGPWGTRWTRNPLLMGEIEPLCDGIRVEWSEDVNEISIYISGSKTDWANQGMVRSHNRIPEGIENAHVCPLRSLTKLWELSPSKSQWNTVRVFATWRPGQAIKPDRVASLLRMAVFAKGLYPSAVSLHALRAGGATALYRATGNIELLARMGRWKTSSISAQLWEIHEVMSGLGLIMAQWGGGTLQRAARDLISLRPARD